MQMLSRSVFFKLFSSRPILHRQIFSRPLKKDLHLESISDSAIFPTTSRCSLKKSLHLESISDSAIFPQRSRCSLNKKGLHFDFISDFLFFFQNQSVLQKKKKKGLHFDFIPGFLILFPKSRGSLKKRSSPQFAVVFGYFSLKIMVISKN